MSAADLPDDDQALAAELAFGLLADDELRRAEARLAGDPDFAAAHRRWQEHVARFFVGDEPPRPSLWPEIVRRLPSNDAADQPRRAPAGFGWKLATAILSAAALVLAVVSVERGARPASPAPLRTAPPLVTVLTGESAQAVAMSFDRSSGRLTLIARDLAPGARVPELWLIPADGRPRALGALAPTGGQWRTAPPATAGLFAPGATVAISLERSGVPLPASPAGPVILSGKLAVAAPQRAG